VKLCFSDITPERPPNLREDTNQGFRPQLTEMVFPILSGRLTNSPTA